MGLACRIAAVICVGSCGQLVTAQDQEVPTLHVYTNTIQVPVLVLGAGREKIAPIAVKRFSLSLDGGPLFRASHVRPEGDDPISLSLLVDMSGPEADLLPKLTKAVAELAPLSLRSQDHISVYTLDCQLIRFMEDAPADPESLRQAMGDALHLGRRERAKHGANCEKPDYLWDALYFVTYQLSGAIGRRVVLAISDGSDGGSHHRWNEVRVFAQENAVAIFGMSYFPDYVRGTVYFQRPVKEDSFGSVCELSGGLVFTASSDDVARKLKRLVEMVRGRYIVEFPRPYNATRGRHELIISIYRSNAFVRSTGISVPLQDAKVLADPTTVHSDGISAPVEGTRRILTSQR